MSALAGPDHQLVVDRVAVDVGAGGAGDEGDVLRRLARDVAAADEHHGDRHADGHDEHGDDR